MQIQGSHKFKSQVSEALKLWQSVDAKAKELMSSIACIKETNDSFRVRTYSDGSVHVARNTAFWPNTAQIIQQRILASYLAHESIHSYALAQESDKWNTPEVEEVALEYQSDVAQKLGISDVYVSSPEDTLNITPTQKYISTVDELPKPLAILVGVTVLALALSKMFNTPKRKRMFVSR